MLKLIFRTQNNHIVHSEEEIQVKHSRMRNRAFQLWKRTKRVKKILCSIMAHVGAIFFRFAWMWCECMWGIAEASLGILSRKRTFSYFRHFLFLLLWRARIAIWYFATAAAVDPLCSPYFVFTFCWVWAFNLQTKGSNVAFFHLMFQKE